MSGTEHADVAEEVGIYLSWVPPGHAKAARAALDALLADRDRRQQSMILAASHLDWLIGALSVSDDPLAVRALVKVRQARAALSEETPDR